MRGHVKAARPHPQLRVDRIGVTGHSGLEIGRDEPGPDRLGVPELPRRTGVSGSSREDDDAGIVAAAADLAAADSGAVHDVVLVSRLRPGADLVAGAVGPSGGYRQRELARRRHVLEQARMPEPRLRP